MKLKNEYFVVFTKFAFSSMLNCLSLKFIRHWSIGLGFGRLNVAPFGFKNRIFEN